MVATRVTKTERALVDAAADLGGVTVGDLVRGILLPEVARRVTKSAREVSAGTTGT